MPPTLPEYLGTVLSVKGLRRAGDADKAYATFLNSPVSDKQVIKQGPLKKKSTKGLYERWNDRYVVLRGNFITVARSNSRVGSVCKVHQVREVGQGTGNCDFKVTTLSGGVLIFKAVSTAERVSWVTVIEDIMKVEDQGPDFHQPKRGAASFTAGVGNGTASEDQHDQDALGDLASFDSSSSANGLTPFFAATEPGMFSPTAASPLSSSTVFAATVDSGQLDGNRRRMLSAPPAVATMTHAAPAGPTTPLENVSHQAAAAATSESSAKRPAEQTTVGIFWDLESVPHPTKINLDEATRAVSKFGSEIGEIDVLKSYPANKNVTSTFIRRSERDILLWLWDHSRRNSGTPLLILMSAADMTPILSAVHDRGVKVVIVTPDTDAVAHLPYMNGQDHWDCITDFRPTSTVWGAHSRLPALGVSAPKAPSTEDLQSLINTFLRAGSTPTTNNSPRATEPQETVPANSYEPSTGDDSEEGSMGSRTASNSGTIYAEQIPAPMFSRDVLQQLEERHSTEVIGAPYSVLAAQSSMHNLDSEGYRQQKMDDQSKEMPKTIYAEGPEPYSDYRDSLPPIARVPSAPTRELVEQPKKRKEHAPAVRLVGSPTLNVLLILANIFLAACIIFGKDGLVNGFMWIAQGLLSMVGLGEFRDNSNPAEQPSNPSASEL
eukprot:CAMPEP_0184289474 /NCGR_PEP_ID=MMETSP1049-20130417/1945_1 /TAXON_ID=77928 /ORGANISM="Proteomonas sulcata, Strain CCMP704" /LENGTH=662 /DNA_ID=CAMNT_0026596317 /DNA_START=85 /DNA_END=2073 /DNA_ORIENTATION=-